MLLTESQASTKWCPKAMHQSGAEEPAANRWTNRDGHHRNPAECCCIASDCMAWRWVVQPCAAQAEGATGGIVNAEKARGYCGLAGKVGG